jgi:hypothetical protein
MMMNGKSDRKWSEMIVFEVYGLIILGQCLQSTLNIPSKRPLSKNNIIRSTSTSMSLLIRLKPSSIS